MRAGQMEDICVYIFNPASPVADYAFQSHTILTRKPDCGATKLHKKLHMGAQSLLAAIQIGAGLGQSAYVHV